MSEIDASRRMAITGGVDVDALAFAVRSCPGVSDLAAGAPGSAATYLPGRRLAGIAVDERRVRVQVRARWAVSLPDVAAQIRAALGPLVGDRSIDVTFADIDDPPGGRRPDGEGSPPTHSLPPGPDVMQPPARPPVTTPSLGARPVG